MSLFNSNIKSLYGDKGKKWLAQLPFLIEDMARRYDLSSLKPVQNMTYHYVLEGIQGQKQIILKLGFDNDGLKREGEALKAFAQYGSVSLLAEEPDMLLLDRVMPGHSLVSFFPKREDESIEITATVMARLHMAPIPTSYPFPHIKDWLRTLDKPWDIPLSFLQKARLLRDELLRTSEKEVFLHGDLHHDNILKSGNNWVVIDPKGVVGDISYEVAAFIRNPISALLEHAEASCLIISRIKSFSKFLNIPQERILHWCFVQAILAWIWAIEDCCDTTYFQKLTCLFEEMLE